MGLSGCYSLIKYLVVLINLIFWIVGIATVGLAIWMFTDSGFYVSMTQNENDYFISICILFACGLLLIIVAFMGCCGSIKESQYMLITFFSLLFIVLVAQIAAALWGYLNADLIKDMVKSSVKTTVKSDYYTVENRRVAFDAFQKGLKCCGADKPTDWIGDRNNVIAFGASAEPTRYDIPESCCRDDVEPEMCRKKSKNVTVGDEISSAVFYQDGCYEKIIDAIKRNVDIIIAVGSTIIVVEVVGLILSIVLAVAINRSRRYKA